MCQAHEACCRQNSCMHQPYEMYVSCAWRMRYHSQCRGLKHDLRLIVWLIWSCLITIEQEIFLVPIWLDHFGPKITLAGFKTQFWVFGKILKAYFQAPINVIFVNFFAWHPSITNSKLQQNTIILPSEIWYLILNYPYYYL